MAVHTARQGVVYMSTTGAGTATNVLHLAHWTINRTQATIETTSFGDSNKTYVPALPDVKGTISGFWDDSESKPFTAAASTTGTTLFLYPDSTSATKYWTGPAWLDVSMDTAVSGAVTISMSFSANGSWTNSF